MDGGMGGRKKSEMTPRFYEGDWENNGTINRNKDTRKSHRYEEEEKAFNFGNTKFEYHGINRKDTQRINWTQYLSTYICAFKSSS